MIYLVAVIILLTFQFTADKIAKNNTYATMTTAICGMFMSVIVFLF